MTTPSPTPPAHRPPDGLLGILERGTALVLILVVLALGWMVLAAFQPGWVRRLPPATEVGIVITLLAASLILVSVVALLHTRA